jgi:hypothetical protein
MRSPRLLAISIGFALAGCSNQAFTLPPTVHTAETASLGRGPLPSISAGIPGSFVVHFGDGRVAHFSDVLISRKVDHAGQWLSIRGRGYESQHLMQSVSSISVVVEGATSMTRALALDIVPIRNPSFVKSPNYVACPQLSGVPSLNGGGCCVLSCGSDGSVWGECSALCGSSGPLIGGGDGTGLGVVYPGDGDIGCNLDFAGGYIDCFASGGTNDVNAPADLYSRFRKDFTKAYLTCFNPVNPGWRGRLLGSPAARCSLEAHSGRPWPAHVDVSGQLSDQPHAGRMGSAD